MMSNSMWFQPFNFNDISYINHEYKACWLLRNLNVFRPIAIAGHCECLGSDAVALRLFLTGHRLSSP